MVESLENNFGQASFMPNLNQNLRRMLEEHDDASSEVDVDA